MPFGLGAFALANPQVTSSLIGAAPGITDSLFGGGGDTTSTTTVDPFSSTSGLGSTSFSGPDGAASVTNLDPRFLQAQDSFLGGSQNSLNQLGAFQTTPFQGSQPFDLEGATQSQFDLLERLQSRNRQQSSQNLEERLFAQGRLGSTGGINEQRNLQDVFSQQQAQNMNSAFGQGLQAQQQQFSQDRSTNSQQIAQQQLLASLSSGLFGSSLAPEQALLGQHNAAGAFAPVTVETESDDGGGLF